MLKKMAVVYKNVKNILHAFDKLFCLFTPQEKAQRQFRIQGTSQCSWSFLLCEKYIQLFLPHMLSLRSNVETA